MQTFKRLSSMPFLSQTLSSTVFRASRDMSRRQASRFSYLRPEPTSSHAAARSQRASAMRRTAFEPRIPAPVVCVLEAGSFVWMMQPVARPTAATQKR